MLEDLIKLSKELLNMDLNKESLEIDSMIHKLYGVGGSTPCAANTNEHNKYSFDLESDVSSLDDIKEIINNNYDNEEFRYGISDILIDSLAYDDLELIKEAIAEYLE